MAKKITISKQDDYSAIVLSRKEAMEMIVYLTGQLADEPVPRNFAGQCPEVFVRDENGVHFIEKVSFVLEQETHAMAFALTSLGKH